MEREVLISRRGVMGLLVGTAAAAAVPGPAAAATGSSRADEVSAFLEFLRRHRADVAMVSQVVTGDARKHPRVSHRPGGQTPVASMAKILHLVAYAEAVGRGRIRAEEPVRARDWEVYLLPGTDGGAHERALEALGVPVLNGRAQDPGAIFTLDQVISAMIEQSDNAAADFVRNRLGARAIAAAAGRIGGVRVPAVPSFLGQMLLDIAADSPYRGMDGIRRLAALPPAHRFALAEEWERRYLAGRQATVALPGFAEQAAWAETTYGMRAAAAGAALLGAVAAGRHVHPNVASIARRHLEWPARLGPLPPGLTRLGTKGGLFPGLLAEASYTAADDGTVRVTALTMHRVPETDWISLATSFAHQRVIARMGVDPAFVTRVAGALAG